MGRIRQSFACLCLLAVLAAWANPAVANNYTWNGPQGGSLTDPNNWTPGGFANAVGDVCDLTSGCQVVGFGAAFAKVTFTAQLNTASSCLITMSGYIQPYTFSNLHLRGGTVVNGSAGTIAGYVTVESNSVLVSGGGDNDAISAVFSGSGNLSFTNREVSGKASQVSADNSAYSGTWTVYNVAGGGAQFGSAANTLGTGGFKLTPSASNTTVSCNTACPWDVDLSGKVVTVTYSYGSCTHSGTITLRSSAIFRVSTDYAGKNGTFTGKITGSGKFLTTGVTSTNRLIVVTNPANDFSGGTEVLTYACRASTKGCLGTGHVHVDAGAWLFAEASGVMARTADIYLDYNGVSYGKLYMGPASVTTMVNRAYVGGTGGWETAVGYTQLLPGIHTSTTDPNYIAGGGALVVANPAGTAILFR